MSLDRHFIIAPSLQEYFVDKDSGLPLSGGMVFFFKNEEPNIPKPVFEISLVGGSYIYTALPNPVILSGVGTFQDASGNDIIPYYFPYDAAGNVELYYIEVYNSAGVLQFTRIAWPNFITDNILSDEDITNFVPNPQFVLHNNESGTTPLSGSQVQTSLNYGSPIGTLSVWDIAQGGWTFEKNSGSTSVDTITFPRFGSATERPTGNPRYCLQIATTVSGSDNNKDICLKFPNVNEFASQTQEYNLYFEAQAINGNIPNVQVYIRKYFGAGGSNAIEIPVDVPITLQTSWQQYNFTLLFGTNENNTIGTGDDDFVQIVIRMPPHGVQTAQFDNFVISVNDSVLATFPTKTYAETYDDSTIGTLNTPVPSDGSTFYLPFVYTATGATFDDTAIGKPYASFGAPVSTELLCDGTSYIYTGYSSLGIPYSRIANKYWIPASNRMRHGTGYQFVNAIPTTSNTALFFLAENSAGTNTAPADATSAPQKTGFTFTNVVTGATAINQRCYFLSTNALEIRTNAVFTFAAPADVNSGMTVTVVRNNSVESLVWTLTCTAGSAITGGHYFTFATDATSYYVWFKVNGVGTDPAPGGTGIEVDVLSTWTAAEVSYAVYSALNAQQITTITTVAGSSVPAGSYFTFNSNANANDYYVWYAVSGVGTDPKVSSTIGIPIAILSGDTAAQVATKTLAAINKFYVGVPDLQGLFLRGLDPNSFFDQDSANRLGTNAGVSGNNLGTLEFDQFLGHVHPPLPPATNIYEQQAGGAGFSGGGNATPKPTTGTAGGTESRPYNSAVNWVVKY